MVQQQLLLMLLMSRLVLCCVCCVCLQVNQAVNQVIISTVPLPIPAALNLPMGASLDINAQTRAGW